MCADVVKTDRDLIEEEDKPVQKNKKVKEINYTYLILLTLTCGFSTMNLGSVLSGTNAASPGIYAHFGYKESEENQKFFSALTILSTASILGVAIGSVIGGNFIDKSRRRPIMLFNCFVIIGSLISIIDNFALICIGRFIYGFSTGVLLAAAPAIIEETVPADIIDFGFGTSTNSMIMIGVLFSFCLGPLVPANPGLWRQIYLLPIPFAITAITMHLIVFKDESVNFHVQRDQKDQAINMLSAIYPQESRQEIEETYLEMRQIIEDASGEQQSPNTMQVLTDPDLRMGTFVCIMIAVFNQAVGVNSINIYATSIFQSIIDDGNSLFVSVETAGIFVGASGFIGAILSNFTVYYLTRRQVFVGGHFIMLLQIFAIVGFLQIGSGNWCLITITLLNITFQATNGSAFWVYTTEVGQDAAMGLCLFTLMIFLLLQALFAVQVKNSMGISGFFSFFGGCQVFTVIFLFFFMKESKGLPGHEKKALFSRTKK